MPFDEIVFDRDRVQVVANEKGWLRVINKGATSGAAILGVLPDGKFILVKESRQELSGPRLVWNIPRGAGDPHESSAQTAIREFYEETGIQVPEARLVKLGKLAPDNGILMSTVDLYGAALQGLAIPEQLKGEDSLEIHDVHSFSKEEIWEMGRQETLTDMFTFAALSLWEAHCRKEGLTASGTRNVHANLSKERFPAFYEQVKQHGAALRALGGTVEISDTFAKVAISWIPKSELADAVEHHLEAIGLYGEESLDE